MLSSPLQFWQRWFRVWLGWFRVAQIFYRVAQIFAQIWFRVAQGFQAVFVQKGHSPVQNGTFKDIFKWNFPFWTSPNFSLGFVFVWLGTFTTKKITSI